MFSSRLGGEHIKPLNHQLQRILMSHLMKNCSAYFILWGLFKPTVFPHYTSLNSCIKYLKIFKRVFQILPTFKSVRYSVFCRWAVVRWRDFLEANLFHVNLKFRIKSILMRIIMIFQTLMITHSKNKIENWFWKI